MNEAVARMLKQYDNLSLEDHLQALREILQEIALLGLWRSKFFDKAAFYGGSALRILYGLDRFSEVMDFSLLSPMDDIDLSPHANQKTTTSSWIPRSTAASPSPATDSRKFVKSWVSDTIWFNPLPSKPLDHKAIFFLTHQYYYF